MDNVRSPSDSNDGDRAGHHAWLVSHQTALRGDRARLLSAERCWSWARLVTFFAAVFAWYPLGEKISATYWSVAAATVLLGWLFVFSVLRHLIVRGRRELIDRILLMVDESLRRCGGAVVLIRSHNRPRELTDPSASSPPAVDDGPTWRLTRQEHMDLDLYAPPVGILGLLNRTSTCMGLRRLCDIIENPCLSIDHIKRRQEAIRWLDVNADKRLRILGAAAVLRGRDALLERLASALHGAVALPSPVRYSALRVWSLLSAAITLAAVVQVVRGHLEWSHPWLALLIVNGLVYARIRRVLNERLAPWKTVVTPAEGYLHAARQAAADLPGEGELGKLRDRFQSVVRRDVLPSLCRRLKWSDAGGMLHAFVNAMFFYDLHVVTSILNCAVRNRRALRRGMAALAELEALTSLACFAFESSGDTPVCYPELVTDRMLSIKSGRHPLIPPRRAVPNDLYLDPYTRVCVITGSNMAGKSTYLRMCGVNCLLAQIGTVVIAEKMTLSPVRLVSDLQVSDNLAEDESYFLAEVRHLRRMVSPDSDAAAILGLMDDPFRGTNSTEQVAAALAVVEHVLKTQDFFLVATHEQRLAELADNSDGAENRHFRENLGADGLVFDYVLQEGPASSRNALRVLERESYPAELLAKARAWLNNARGTEGNARG